MRHIEGRPKNLMEGSMWEDRASSLVDTSLLKKKKKVHCVITWKGNCLCKGDVAPLTKGSINSLKHVISCVLRDWVHH